MPKKKPIVTSLDEEMQDLLPTEGEIFAVALEPLGKARFKVKCADGTYRIARVRGKLRGRRHWIKPGNVVLVSVWDFEPDKADIVVKYRRDQVEWLVEKGYIEREFLEEEEELY
uniref:Translation initiation factor 1A n=1 Tax=uncultured korarchaeote TaxID=161241 RepID=A0A1L2JMQ7_9CREN|nr:translation initiation factor 1 (IF-1) [uncultured korarchaeote]